MFLAIDIFGNHISVDPKRSKIMSSPDSVLSHMLLTTYTFILITVFIPYYFNPFIPKNIECVKFFLNVGFL